MPADATASAQRAIAQHKNPRVVVIGAGFAGMTCALQLGGTRADVLLMDKKNYHLFSPLIYQVATALLSPSEIAYPVRLAIRKHPNLRFQNVEVSGVDPEAQVVKTSVGTSIPYDYLVIAGGSETHSFGKSDVEKLGFGLKDLEDAVRLRGHVLSCLEKAVYEENEETRKALLSFCVIGGGQTGIEYIGALAEWIDSLVPKAYKTLRREDIAIHLIEGGDRVLPSFDSDLSAWAHQVLEKKNVEIHLNTFFQNAEDECIVVGDNHKIPTCTLVWVAGVKAGSFAESAEAPLTQSKRIETDAFLRMKGYANIFAIGDIAAVIDQGQELPMVSPPAMQGGRYVAKAILKAADDGLESIEKIGAFRYYDKGSMATIGRSAAIAQVGKIKLKGFIGWVAWLVVHVFYLFGFDNRLSVIMKWTWYFFRNRRHEQYIHQEKNHL